MIVFLLFDRGVVISVADMYIATCFVFIIICISLYIKLLRNVLLFV